MATGVGASGVATTVRLVDIPQYLKKSPLPVLACTECHTTVARGQNVAVVVIQTEEEGQQLQLRCNKCANGHPRVSVERAKRYIVSLISPPKKSRAKKPKDHLATASV